MKLKILMSLALVFAALGTGMALAAVRPSNMELSKQELSSYGVFYDQYEPTFYTGFAPRSSDPDRIHLHVGRGNQLRATVVLSDSVVENYARDLQTRHRTYRRLIDERKLVLTQNKGFDRFDELVLEMRLDDLVDAESMLSEEALRERNLELIRRLNPDRIFSIRLAVNHVVEEWMAGVVPGDRNMDKARQLQLLNSMLPTRLWITGMDSAVAVQLKQLVSLVLEQKTDPADLKNPFVDLLGRVSGSLYPVKGDFLEFHEFTAIYPVGTLNQMTSYKGRSIPLYPTPGKWLLTTHQRTKTVDHIPDKIIYSYSPWIPYMHVGKKLHNSFHTLWWRMRPEKTSFLPAELKHPGNRNRDGKNFSHLWLLSRGPMSHGCTHVNAGHIMELRQILPADTDSLYKVAFFINKSGLFDIFDIDGDFQPEVMGVRYFVAFSLNNKRPHTLRAPIAREAFYSWLYGGELEYDSAGNGYFRNIQDSRFVGRKSADGNAYRNISLYEASYQPEKLQFYSLIDIPFARKLRKVGLTTSIYQGSDTVLK